MRIRVQTLPALLSVLFLFPTLACGTLIRTNNLVYDSQSALSWTDGNFADPNKKLTWEEAHAWVASLNTNNYGGYHDWRLPSTPLGSTWGYDANTNITKFEVTVSELGFLYYESLGQAGEYTKQCDSQDGCKNNSFVSGDKDFSPFTTLKEDVYWFGTAGPTDNNPATWQFAWQFHFGSGAQFLATTNTGAWVIAVRNVSPVPEPTTGLLFAVGLAWLCRVRRRPLCP